MTLTPIIKKQTAQLINEAQYDAPWVATETDKGKNLYMHFRYNSNFPVQLTRIICFYNAGLNTLLNSKLYDDHINPNH